MRSQRAQQSRIIVHRCMPRMRPAIDGDRRDVESRIEASARQRTVGREHCIERRGEQRCGTTHSIDVPIVSVGTLAAHP